MTAASSGYVDFITGQLKIAGMRARLITTEIDFIGVALKANLIDADGAMEWMAEIGALGLITGAPSATTLVST